MTGDRLSMKYRMMEESGAWARAMDHQVRAMGYGCGFTQEVLQAKEMARKPKSWCMLDFMPRCKMAETAM